MLAGMAPPTGRKSLRAQTRPEAKITAFEGRAYCGHRLREAIRDAKGKSEPIHLILQLDNFISTVDIDYHDGERYPILERVEGTPGYLDDSTKPLVPPQPARSKPIADNH